MSNHDLPDPHAHPAPAAGQPAAAPVMTGRAGSLYVVALLALAGLVSSALLWQRLGSIQEQLARQSADSGSQAIEARTIARESQDQVRDLAGRLTVIEARVNEVALQRSQLEELMQSLSRSRDENLVVDIESALRLAEQQTQLTGSLQPLQATLHSAVQRIERAAQPRLAPVQRAMEQDLERLGRLSVTDTTGLLGRLDDLVRQVDELPLLNAMVGVAKNSLAKTADAQNKNAPPAPASQTPGWQRWLQAAWTELADEVRSLVRVSRIDHPDAVLLAPEQAFFLRENLKLKLLNARLGLLARRMDSARSDLAFAQTALEKYFDPASRRTQAAQAALMQLQTHMRAAELPQLDDSYAALAIAAAGR